MHHYEMLSKNTHQQIGWYLSLADVLNNDAHKTSITDEQPADNTISLWSVDDIWNEAREATDANLLQQCHIMA